MRKGIFVVFLLTLGIFGIKPAAAVAQTTLKDKYRAVQVDRFDIKEGVQFPVDYLITLQEEILKQLQASKQFQEVLRPGENPNDGAAEVLRLTGTINHFKPGSRAKRYIGFGGGATEIYAHLYFVDGSTGQTVLTQEVRGMMAGGFVGGESLKVTRDFAKKVVNTVKLVQDVPLAVPGEAAPAERAAAPAPAADRHTVAIVSSDFEGAEKKLNEEGAAGYRLAEFSSTGSRNAEAIVEKSPRNGGTFQYRLLRARLAGNLQKNLNRAAGEGFHLCPHSVSLFGGVMAAIAEKTSASTTVRREYRVHQTMRISSAQKDLKKDKNQGFELAENLEYGSGMHLLVTEKVLDGAGE